MTIFSVVAYITKSTPEPERQPLHPADYETGHKTKTSTLITNGVSFLYPASFAESYRPFSVLIFIYSDV